MPYFRSSAGRLVGEHGGVVSASFPDHGWGCELFTSRLLRVADHVFAPAAELTLWCGSDTTTVMIGLAGSVRVQLQTGGVRTLGAKSSILCATPKPTAVLVANPLKISARIVQVTFAGSGRPSLEQGSTQVDVPAATVTISKSGFDSGDRPGVVYVCNGTFKNENVDRLDAGDWCEFPGTNTDIATISGHGELLVIELNDVL